MRRSVRHGWFEGRCRSLTASLHSVELPLALRVALRILLRQRIPEALNDPQPARTVGGLAEAVGVTRPHLSTTATAHGIPLASLAARWTAILALERRMTSDLTWEAIAWRCGYAGVSGLSELFMVQFGRRLRAALREVDLAIEMDRFRSAMGVGDVS